MSFSRVSARKILNGFPLCAPNTAEGTVLKKESPKGSLKVKPIHVGILLRVVNHRMSYYWPWFFVRMKPVDLIYAE